MAFLVILPADLQLNILQTWVFDEHHYSDVQLLQLLSQLDRACYSRALRPEELLQLMQLLRFETKAVPQTQEWFWLPHVKHSLGCMRWLAARKVQIRTLDIHLPEDQSLFWKQRPDWRGIWLPFVETLHIRKIGTTEDLVNLLSCCPNITSIGTNSYLEECMHMVVSRILHANNNDRVDYFVREVPVILDALRHSKLPKLRILSTSTLIYSRVAVDNDGEEYLCSTLRTIVTQLEQVNLRYISSSMKPTDMFYFTLTKQLLSLKFLDIDVNAFTDADIERMLATCTRLTTVRLYKYGGTVQELLTTVLQSARQLKHFFVVFNPRHLEFTDNSKEFAHLLEHLPWLESLSTNCHLYDRNACCLKVQLCAFAQRDVQPELDMFARNCKMVRKLNLLGVYGLQVRHFHFLGQHFGPHLLELAVSNLFGEISTLMVPYCPNLINLYVKGHDCDLRIIAQCCSVLECFHWHHDPIRGEGGTIISEIDWEFFLNGCRRLKEICVVGIASKPTWRMLEVLVTLRLRLRQLVWAHVQKDNFLEMLGKIIWTQQLSDEERFRQLCKEQQLLPAPTLSILLTQTRIR